jgi:O-acetylhomoserine (thiol)-lyase|tara:strand:+ start:139 stop:1956 length:1818 start_codon:yes stop_codon:yes gene_type:complete
MAIEERRQLSPLRNTTDVDSAQHLAIEQAQHFGIDPDSDFGVAMVELASRLYEANQATHDLWKITIDGLATIDRQDRIAWFNAKRFISFQLAKILDTLQNPLRASYQSITTDQPGFATKGAYPLFDNVAAIFSATPVITRTATYLFACTEWVEDAFCGREPLHDIYSRLMNPTSVSLANHIVDIECGAEANRYMAWNFNSGMAAIDGIMSHLVNRDDIVLASRNIYGGSYQLLHDWYAKESKLGIALSWFDGYDGSAFAVALDELMLTHADRLAEGRNVFIYLESPCNPHGYVLDVPGISRIAHEQGFRVIVDSTVGTPFLHPLLKVSDGMQRPDFVVHSYTKELTGTGTTTAGVVIGRNEDMFIPKHTSSDVTWPDGSPRTVNWDESLFWNVYYIKGGFLDADKAFEVLNGIKTYEMRILQKTINTILLARVLAAHPDINVSCPVLTENTNHALLAEHMYLGLPAPLFTLDMEGRDGRPPVNPAFFKRFLDALEPAVGMQVSLGQTNSLALCPAMTTHSELSESALAEAGIAATTLRISVGLEDPRLFLAHFIGAARLALEPEHRGFCALFPQATEIDTLYAAIHRDVSQRHIDASPGIAELMA